VGPENLHLNGGISSRIKYLATDYRFDPMHLSSLADDVISISF
jgi:hypothetical protein